MVTRSLFLLLFLLTTMSALDKNVFAQQPPIEAGVSRELARWRAAHYSDVRYKLNLTLEKMSPLMKGDIEIRVNLSDEGAKNDLILDWRTTQFASDKDKPYANVTEVNGLSPAEIVNGKVQKVTRDSFAPIINEHLTISKYLLKTGENVIKINFASPIKTSGAAVTRYVDKEDGAEYIYSLFVPSDASTAFPVFDQPDLKAKFSLTLHTPIDWNAISNGKINSYSDAIYENLHPDKFEAKHENIFKFEETQPISTYVFAFAAGDFRMFQEKSVGNNFVVDVNDRQRNFGTFQGTSIFVRKSQAEKFKLHAAEVFRLNREAVKFLETYFDYKFPFPKYDLVLIPEFPFGGMEHAGATFLRESSIIFPSEPTANDYISRANVIFHEAAHQWFGDTVTMRWFDDLWLKEGFAEFMAYKTMEKVLPQYNAWKAFYERNKPLAYLTDSTRGTTPIYQEIPNLSAAKSAYGNIVYRKAPAFLRQAEFYLGADKFQIAVRQFLKQNAFKNAEWQDLVKSFESATGKDLKKWAEIWVKEPGVFKIRVVRGMPCGENSTLYPLEIKAEHNLNTNIEPIMTFRYLVVDYNSQTESQFEFPVADILKKATIVYRREPFFIFPNYQDYGYGIFLLDEKSRNYVLANIQNEKDDFLRSMMWGALWDSVREAELNPKDYVELAVKNIGAETDELTIQTILNRVATAMNYYLSDEQRIELAPKVEAVLFIRMRDAKTLGQKVTFFRAYLNIASTENAQNWLKKFLKSNGKPIEYEVTGDVVGKIPPLVIPPLKTKDKFDIVTKLLILENKRIIGNNEAEKMLAELEKTETSDEAKRYAYAARAGIAAPENKQKYFADFLDNKEISESYIESAVTPFNSIRHAETTLPFLEKALTELPNLKRNRKIFFVNNWLGAFLGGQKSEQALQIVNKFLVDNPNLDRDLRLKVLENVDGLERAVKIRKRFEN